MRPFSANGKNVNIDVSASSQNVLVSANSEPTEVRIMNNGSATAWFALGTSSTLVATLAASIPIGPGGIEVLHVSDGPVYAAAIAAGSTGKIYFMPGNGA